MKANKLNKPSTEDEWKIHVLNIHGTFFERWCVEAIKQNSPYKIISTNFPVHFGGKESNLDIRAEVIENCKNLNLVIECKKNNPAFTEWIFFPSRDRAYLQRFEMNQLVNTSLAASTRWRVEENIIQLYFDSIAVTDEARETKGNYLQIKDENKEKTRTSNAAIYEAATQVAVATKSIFTEEKNKSQKMGAFRSKFSKPWESFVLLPMIITNAKLFTCEFDPNDVSEQTGEIDFVKTKLTEQPYLVYEFPLPTNLQTFPRTENDFRPDSYIRMQIMIVNSIHLKNFLKVIREKISKVVNRD